MTKTSKNYDVGFGKPPQHSRFQKGQSGNPKGRPKGSLNLATAVNRALREKLVVVVNGRRTTITKLDAAITGMVNRAVKGDAKAMQHLLGLAPYVGMENATASSTLGASDAAVMENLMKRFSAADDSVSD